MLQRAWLSLDLHREELDDEMRARVGDGECHGADVDDSNAELLL